MGEVYRARDSKLKREVALKVLSEAFVGDAERLARFTREAEVLAALNHPNIATIYGVEEGALVMELVEGDTLAEIIVRGALPIEIAIAYARQICDALEAAHEKGIVHRDLKPANVKVTPDGLVKVLDFGLAAVAQSAAAHTASSDLVNSPTMTMSPTRAGVILGTAAYMAPEQARGSAVDRRADIWAFGVLLYEMLTGRHTFSGETVTDVLASVMKDQPDLSRVPERVRPALERCLAKDRRSRWGSIGDVRWALESAGTVAAARPAGPPVRPAWQSRFGIAAAVVALLVGAAALWGWLRISPVPPHSVTRTTIEVQGRF
jgi:serine/threonine-protein kinase